MFNQDLVDAKNAEIRKKIAPYAGPWQTEPDREEFKHAGLDCLIQRGPMGAWCGYVAVTPTHKWYGRPYSTYCEGSDDDPNVVINVHGGLTYSEFCGGSICHKTEGDDKAWWFGFDCGHAWDVIPSWEATLSMPDSVYRDVDYVRNETKRLAEQLAAIV